MTTPQEAAASIANLGVSPSDILKLSKATDPKKVKQRQGAKRHGGDCMKAYGVCQLEHQMLDYVTARYVMDTLDDVVGPDNWQSEHTMQGDKVACKIGIRINGEWVWKSDGAGETDIEGEKGSFSDALKRAAVSWGIARDLYPDAATHQGAPSGASTNASADAGQSRPAPAPPSQGGVCPVHGKPWRKGSNGRPDFCSTKVGDGWCQEHPE